MAHEKSKAESLVQHVYLPEGENYEAGDDENDSKDNEYEVARPLPTCIVEHLG